MSQQGKNSASLKALITFNRMIMKMSVTKSVMNWKGYLLCQPTLNTVFQCIGCILPGSQGLFAFLISFMSLILCHFTLMANLIKKNKRHYKERFAHIFQLYC